MRRRARVAARWYSAAGREKQSSRCVSGRLVKKAEWQGQVGTRNAATQPQVRRRLPGLVASVRNTSFAAYWPLSSAKMA